ncbi:hypothetical protein GCM10009099_41040 [Caenispirillum bisanense]
MRPHRRGIDDRHDLHSRLRGTQHRDFGKVAAAQQDDAVPAAAPALRQQLTALRSGRAEEGQGNRKVLGRQPALLGETGGRQVIGVAVQGHRADLDQPLAHAPAQIGVGETEGDPKLAGKPALGEMAVAFDGLQHSEHNANVSIVVHAGLHGPSYPVGRLAGRRLTFVGVVYPVHAVNVNRVHGVNAMSQPQWNGGGLSPDVADGIRDAANQRGLAGRPPCYKPRPTEMVEA